MIDNKLLFYYIICFIIIIYYFSKIRIELNIIFGFIIAIICIIYLNKENENKIIKNNDILDNKKRLLIPKINNAIKYDDVTHLLFNIQDLYIYNPQAYIEFTDNIDVFFDQYETAIKDNSNAGILYNYMIEIKKNSINNLHSIIHNLPSNKNIINKLNDAINNTETILNIYLDDIQNIYEQYIYYNGITNKTTLLNNNSIQPSNSYGIIIDDYDITSNYSVF
jgi:hypothetical protein